VLSFTETAFACRDHSHAHLLPVVPSSDSLPILVTSNILSLASNRIFHLYPRAPRAPHRSLPNVTSCPRYPGLLFRLYIYCSVAVKRRRATSLVTAVYSTFSVATDGHFPLAVVGSRRTVWTMELAERPYIRVLTRFRVASKPDPSQLMSWCHSEILHPVPPNPNTQGSTGSDGVDLCLTLTVAP